MQTPTFSIDMIPPLSHPGPKEGGLELSGALVTKHFSFNNVGCFIFI